jgi:hypothetical protein
VEPEFAKSFRLWRERWEERTNSKLNIADGLAYLKTPGHFLPSIEERQKLQRTGTTKRVTDGAINKATNEIDQLLASEGLPSSYVTDSGAESNTQSVSSVAIVKKETSLDIESDKLLWLLVKYKTNPDVWTMPFTSRREKDTAFDTLTKICADQIGIKPHFPSLSPFAFRRFASSHSDAPSSRVFYYKAVFVPKTSEVRLPNQSEVLVHRWVSRSQLPDLLTKAAWSSLKDAIPLD